MPYDTQAMNQVLLSPASLIGLAMADSEIECVPAGAWAIEDALLLMEGEAVKREIDCLHASFRTWRTQGSTSGLSGLMSTLRGLQAEGDLVVHGSGMTASFLPDPAWQLENRALRAALGSDVEQTTSLAGQRIVYLNTLRTTRSNTETRSLESKASTSTSGNKRRHV